jgi:hypothetical protein
MQNRKAHVPSFSSDDLVEWILPRYDLLYSIQFRKNVEYQAVMMRLTRPISTTTMPKGKTFWVAQVHVIGELLAVRRATTISTGTTTNGAGRSFSTTSRTFGSSMSQRITSASLTGNTLRTRPTTGNERNPWARYGNIPTTATRMMIQNRGFHATRRTDLPAPAVIFAAGALLKVRPCPANP